MRAESQLKRMKVGEEKRPSWAGQHWVGGVLWSRCSSEIDVRAAVKWEGLLELLNGQPSSFHNSQGGIDLHRSRQRFSGSNMTITNTHAPSDTHSNSAILPAQVETDTLVPELENFPFKALYHSHHGDDRMEISSSDITNELPHNETAIKQLENIRHMAMTSDPAEAKLVVDANLVLGVQSEVGLGVDSDLGLRMEPEVILGADSEVGLGAELYVILGEESDEDRTLDLKYKLDETQNEEGNSNMSHEHKHIISPAAETLSTASLSKASDFKTTRNSIESTNQELDCKSSQHVLASKEEEKKKLQPVNSENTISPNKATSTSMNSFRKLPLQKCMVSPEPSPSLSSQKLHPLHPVRTLTHTEKQSMRKVIAIGGTKPHPTTHSHSSKAMAPTTYASSGTATPVFVSPTPKMSSIQKSLARKLMISQKSAPKEKICRTTLRTLAMATQECHKTTPGFASSTVASTTRSAFTTSNAPVTQKEVPTAPIASSLNRSVPHRASRLSMPSRTGRTDLLLPHGHIKNVKAKPVRPVWR